MCMYDQYYLIRDGNFIHQYVGQRKGLQKEGKDVGLAVCIQYNVKNMANVHNKKKNKK